MVYIRKFPLVTDEMYHIFNKSIAGYKIFSTPYDFKRMLELFKYYQWGNRKIRFYQWKRIKDKELVSQDMKKEDKLVTVIAYCVMPTHIHLVLKQLKDRGISIFMSLIANSYTRYFNEKYKRKGPLWEKEFSNVLVKTDEQLLHFTRYIHLNPVTAYLVDKPEEWFASSYKEYLGKVEAEERLCEFEDILDISPQRYKKFVDDRIDYQRELSKIKHLLLEPPSSHPTGATRVDKDI